MSSQAHQHVERTEKPLPQVKTVLAVASGKGGVGKSTVAVNLAMALKSIGKRVGLLDADVYGPSQHIMLGLHGVLPEMSDDQKIIPVEKYGIKLMSFGFFVKPDDAVIWRGPMIHRLIQQFIFDVNWGELDVLVVDLPPGTGDAQLSLTQTLPLTGAVIVSTPQDVALADAIKGVNMFQKVQVPIVGMIENMSYFECPKCSHKAHIFSHAGASEKAKELNVPFLGELPLEEVTRVCGDEGVPVVEREPGGDQAARFLAIAKNVWLDLEENSKKERPSFFEMAEQQKASQMKPEGFEV